VKKCGILIIYNSLWKDANYVVEHTIYNIVVTLQPKGTRSESLCTTVSAVVTTLGSVIEIPLGAWICMVIFSLYFILCSQREFDISILILYMHVQV